MAALGAAGLRHSTAQAEQTRTECRRLPWRSFSGGRIHSARRSCTAASHGLCMKAGSACSGLEALCSGGATAAGGGCGGLPQSNHMVVPGRAALRTSHPVQPPRQGWTCSKCGRCPGLIGWRRPAEASAGPRQRSSQSSAGGKVKRSSAVIEQVHQSFVERTSAWARRRVAVQDHGRAMACAVSAAECSFWCVP